jgi:hypothetical protein
LNVLIEQQKKVAGSWCTWLNFGMRTEGLTHGGFLILILENFALG